MYVHHVTIWMSVLSLCTACPPDQCAMTVNLMDTICVGKYK